MIEWTTVMFYRFQSLFDQNGNLDYSVTIVGAWIEAPKELLCLRLGYVESSCGCGKYSVI